MSLLYGRLLGHQECLEETNKSLIPFLIRDDDTETNEQIINRLVEQVEAKSGFAPNDINITFVALPGTGSVDAEKQKIYNGFAPDLGRPAFSDLLARVIYFDCMRVTQRMLRHEIGHILFEMVCTERPSPELHECVAQFCEGR